MGPERCRHVDGTVLILYSTVRVQQLEMQATRLSTGNCFRNARQAAGVRESALLYRLYAGSP